MKGIDPSFQNHESISPSLAALQNYLSDDEIETICRQLGQSFRHRLLPPGTLVRSIIYRSLHPDKSIQSTLADLIAEDRCSMNPVRGILGYKIAA